MKTRTIVVSAALVVALGAGGLAGYWLGGRGSAAMPDGAQAAAPAASAAPARKLLYYRNPMGLADTSPTPKKDQMGMDYIAVYEGEDASSGEPGAERQIRISTEKVQRLGVRTEAASLRRLDRSVRASGRVEPDERRVYSITPKFEGYVERLHVNVTGQPVAKGQALFEVYSPELVSAQREYLIAAEGVKAMQGAGAEAQAGMRQLVDSSLSRLRNWDLSPEQVSALVSSGDVRRSITFRSPVAGIVTEKKALQGMRFMPGEALYQVTDLSSVWVMADVFERDIAFVRPGSKAAVKINAYPEQNFAGTITYIYPSLNVETRTVPVRIELSNPRQQLKPAMFAQVELQIGAATPVLTVPDSAVIDSGTRRVVLVQRGEGRFEPRDVRLGARGDQYVEVLEGVREGELVVIAANFLIDAESNLQAAFGGLSGAGAGGAAKAASGAEPAGGQPSSEPAGKRVGHRAEGTVESIDRQAGTVTLTHRPVASLKWPAMTMEFKLANLSLSKALEPGTQLSFEFIERQAGEWVITSVTPAPAKRAVAKPPSTSNSGHSGH